ncbi:unnamed protein product [Mytilus edulis]|uniref:Uncharacterized protein n=1 Tax=Mytilus edulis TaxID=6550 RepID=A0A8S3T3K0_MYTED|nr:unnamed protein product [Mytilus edulis]
MKVKVKHAMASEIQKDVAATEFVVQLYLPRPVSHPLILPPECVESQTSCRIKLYWYMYLDTFSGIESQTSCLMNYTGSFCGDSCTYEIMNEDCCGKNVAVKLLQNEDPELNMKFNRVYICEEISTEAIRVGNRAAVTKLWIKFEELKENPENVKMEEFKAIEYAVTQKKKIIHDLNEKMKEIQHEDHIEQEITDSDEYMFDLDSKLKQIRKLKQTIKSPNNNSNLKESKQ